jgi:XTP/dITP diphosphohydrolase
MPALADDSGLVVRRSRRRARHLFGALGRGRGKDFDAAIEEVERRLQVEDALAPASTRRAYFVAVLSLAWPDGDLGGVSRRGRWTSWSGRRAATSGFGYDPMFVHDGHAMTYGEMDPAAKHRISHRAVAFAKLLAACLA